MHHSSGSEPVIVLAAVEEFDRLGRDAHVALAGMRLVGGGCLAVPGMDSRVRGECRV